MIIKCMGRMMDVSERKAFRSIGLAGDIVSAYVANNSVPASELPNLIGRIHAVLNGLVDGTSPQPPIESERKATPAQIGKSVTADALISFIDGKAYKTLKRHLAVNGFDPTSYRERYGLPVDYPMVAPGYAEQRSKIAKAIGLGQSRAGAEQRRTGTRGGR